MTMVQGTVCGQEAPDASGLGIYVGGRYVQLQAQRQFKPLNLPENPQRDFQRVRLYCGDPDMGCQLGRWAVVENTGQVAMAGKWYW